MPDIHPSVWAKCAWETIRTFVVNYEPSEDRPIENLVAWVNALPHVLPCGMCRANFSETLKKYPIEQYLNQREHWFDLIKAQEDTHKDTGSNTKSWVYIIATGGVLLLACLIPLALFLSQPRSPH